MSYTVLWVPDAERELATLWMNAAARSAVTDAANEIDRRLRANPETEGESRPNGLRVFFVPPLAITYEIQTLDRLVQVLDVWMPEERSR